MMRRFDIIEKVAGRGAADKLHIAQIEKQYAKTRSSPQDDSNSSASSSLSDNIDENRQPPNLQSRGSATEHTISLEPREGSKYYERTNSTYIRANGIKSPARPTGRPTTLQRAQSELVSARKSEYRTSLVSPDLSCAEFPERPVSTFEGYDPKTNPCPPMGEMKGMGRYRHSVHSTKEWEIEHIKKGLGSFADYVDDDFEIAEAPGVVKHIRKESTASEVSGPHSEYSEGTDPDTGSYVVRGFMPSGSSSSAASFRETHRRANSGILVSGRDDGSPPSRPISRKSSICPFGSLHLTPLTPINETAAGMVPKKTVQLTFATTKGGAEQAIDSDDGDEEFEDASLPEIRHVSRGSRLAVDKANTRNQPADTVKVEKAQKPGANVERMKTVKQLAKPPPLRRSVSHGKHQAGRPTSGRKSSEERVQMAEKNGDGKHEIVEDQEKIGKTETARDGDTSSIDSASTGRTAVAAINPGKPTKIEGRKRSVTAFRVPSTTRADVSSKIHTINEKSGDTFTKVEPAQEKVVTAIAIPQRRRFLRY